MTELRLGSPRKGAIRDHRAQVNFHAVRFFPRSKICLGKAGLIIGNIGHRSFSMSKNHTADTTVDHRSTLLMGRVGVGTIHSRCPPSRRFLSVYSSLKVICVSRLTK